MQDVVIVDDVPRFEAKPEYKLEPQVVGRHDYYPSNKDQTLCAHCEVKFDDHYHRLGFLQKLIAGNQGKQWSRASFKERQEFKQIAIAWMAAQVERQMAPYVKSFEAGSEAPVEETPQTEPK